MIDHATIRRLRAIDALIARGATEGERAAARLARDRIMRRVGASDTASPRTAPQPPPRPAPPPPPPRRPASPPPPPPPHVGKRLQDQPRMQDIIRMTKRPGGMKLAAMAAELNLKTHSIRASICRLRQEKVPIDIIRGDHGRATYIYRNPRT